jgi:pseudouridine-5'-phosphate glycosidase
MDLTNPTTVTFAATAASTAIEGVHRIDEASTAISKDNNYLGAAKVVMLTDGISAPLAGPSSVLVRQLQLLATVKLSSGTPVSVTELCL